MNKSKNIQSDNTNAERITGGDDYSNVAFMNDEIQGISIDDYKDGLFEPLARLVKAMGGVEKSRLKQF